ncbi:MAG: CDP-alcohol phosphatidyltransferase family protein [Candidatus Hydrogenedentes bacterium]|nr:CDP-alcohol phosphatidyltransferase family protein [Candidatus Hydrogenedentota bacterium]
MNYRPRERSNFWIVQATTILRLALLLPVTLMILSGNDFSWLVLTCLVLATLLDFFDGKLARRLGQCTAFGQFLDQFADRTFYLACGTLLIFHTVRTGQMGYGQWLTILIVFFLARDHLASSLQIMKTKLPTAYETHDHIINKVSRRRTLVCFPMIWVTYCSVSVPASANATLPIFAHTLEVAALIVTLASIIHYLWCYRRVIAKAARTESA